jgi:hypothetical protein
VSGRRDRLDAVRAYRLISGSVAAALALAGCTNDLDAPYNYPDDTGGDSSDSGGEVLAIECGGELLRAAVGGTFTTMITATGGDGTYMFDAVLPAGFEIDPAGVVTGTPEQEGTAMLEITVTDGSGLMGSQVCPVEVSPQVSVELDLDTVPYCITGAAGDTLRELLVPGTGDGSPVTCAHAEGSGAGHVPNGITIDPETCELQGSVTEVRYGTWAFIVRGTQSGANVFVPYCATNDEEGPFTITADHSGRTDNALEPKLVTFDPTEPAFAGDPGDPVIRVVDPNACGDGTCNFYGYSFFIYSSGFDLEPDIYDEDDDGMTNDSKPIVVDNSAFDDGNGDPVGMQHGLRLSTNGPVVAPLDTRPWVATLHLDYCLGENGMDCPSDDITANADGFFVFSTIMVPQP